MTTRKTLWLAVSLLWLGVSPSRAQLYSGSITGVITDPSSAVVPGAKITLEDQDKGFVFRAESDASGRYLLRSVPPSTYKMSVEAQGFQTQARTGIRVDINQSVTVDFSLPLRSSTETVTITSEAPLLAAEEASLGQVVDRKFMDSLPLVGRNTLGLSYLAPGVNGTAAGRQQVEESANNFVSNGGRAWTSDVLVDGVTATNYEQNGGLQMVIALPSPDAIGEFKVQTSQFSAEFGFTGATVVNMVMRSGTNKLHGSLYEYFRNSALNANNFFNNARGAKRPVFGRNNFGATLGGHIKPNKTFFFVDYDGARQKTMRTRTFGVPSAAERTGDFGELCGYKGGTFDASGRCSAAAGQLWDPMTGVYSASAGGAVRSTFIPFNNLATYISPGNPKLNGTPYALPLRAGNLIDPVVFKEMQYMPLPNVNVGTPAYQYFNNWIGSGTEPQSNNQADVKIDHRFSDSTLLSGKYTDQHENHRRYNAFGNAADTGAIGQDYSYLYLAGLNLTHTFSPSLLLTASYGWNRFREDLPGVMGDYPGMDPVKLLGLPDYMKASGESVFPGLAAGDSYARNTISVGTQGWTHIKRGQDTHQALATLSWIKGSHELKFGGEVRMYRINWYQPGNPGGNFNFNYRGSSQTPSNSTGGDAMASMMMGFPNGGGSYSVSGAFSTQNFAWGGFVQDNWKVKRNLTLNIGLRYDVYVPRTERYNRMTWLDPSVVSPLSVPALGTLHGAEIFASANDRHPYYSYYNNLQPRFGFAWTVQEKTVVRGGYGIFTSPSRVGVSGGGFGGNGFSRDTSSITTMNSDGATPWGRVSDPFPGTGPLMPLGNSLGMMNDVGFAASAPIRTDKKTPYEQSWSLGIQRQLRWGFVTEASYVGKKGTNLYFGGDSNLNHLGAQIEQYSAAQIANMLTYVANPFQGIITNPNSSLSGPTVQQYRLQLPYPHYTSFGGDSPPEGNSMYNSLQLRLEKRFSNGFQFLATYVFSKALDDASNSNNSWNTGGTSLQNPNNRHLEYSTSQFDITHVFRFNHVYDLPFGKGKKFGSGWNPVVNGVLGGWQINGIWEFSTGRPLSLGLQGGYSLPTYGGQRPDLVGRPERNTGSDWMTKYFADNSVFVAPARYAVGNAPRTLPWVRTPSVANANLSVTKEFSLAAVREEMRLRFIAQTLNAFNTPLFSGPNTTVGSSAFGTVTGQSNGPREVELALKLTF